VRPREADRPEYSLGLQEAEHLRDAEREFKARPVVSIRLRIVAGFLVCFFLTGATALVILAGLYQARSELRFLRTTDELSFEIQQARRYEKDYFLYGTNLQVAKAHADKAWALLEAETVSILDVAGEDNLAVLRRHLDEYRRVLEECLILDRATGPNPSARGNQEKILRDHGAQLVDLARSLSVSESASTDRMLRLAQILPFVFLGLLLLLIFWVAHLLAKTITRSLDRFQGYTQRIAEGDFSPIRPAKPYQDEFSDLALAVNRMLFELRAREAQVTRAGKLAALGTFTAGIAHELNNPLNNISITVEALLEECKDPADDHKKRLLEDIYLQTERANESVRGVLDFAHDARPDSAPFDAAEVVASARRLVENEMRISGVEFVEDVPPDLPPFFGAYDMARQILLNLFLNAIQAMPEGGRLTVRVRQAEGGQACIEVIDEGEGISPDVLPLVFDPFFTTKARGVGTGLGLSICRDIARKHGGEISLESAVGRGTTVRVCLPLASGAEANR
jgi:two-component system NtrC family sensor kinase